jgi:two-component system, chemotaxis family, sensor kinase Cph1
MTDAFDSQLLAACEQERLDLIGAIQPFGVLLGGDAGDARVHLASADAQVWLGVPQGPVPGQALGDLVPVRLADFPAESGRKRIMPGLMEGPKGWLDAVLTNTGAGWLLELEPLGADDPVQPLANPRLGRLFQAPQSEPDLGGYSLVLAEAVRHATGYGRVMVYRFLPDECGEVLAESGSDPRPRYLGQRFPASDIPRIARELYRLNSHRQIPDIAAVPVPIVSVRGRAADLTLSDLRAVSPVHLEYLKNMEVVASLSFSIQVAGALWGLVACHHASPRFLSVPVRAHCVELTHSFALGVGSFLANQRLRRVAGLEGRLATLVGLVQDAESGARPFALLGPAMLDLFQAEGAALVDSQGVHAFGAAPAESEIAAIDRWVLGQGGEGVLATDRLGAQSGLTLDQARAAGALAVRAPVRAATGARVSAEGPTDRRLYWFRPELPRTVRWAGNPRKPVGVDPATGILNPRRSFAEWVETARGCSAPWDELDLMGARMLRLALLKGRGRAG